MTIPAGKSKNTYVRWADVHSKKGEKMKKIYMIVTLLVLAGLLGGCEITKPPGGGGDNSKHVKSDKGPSVK